MDNLRRNALKDLVVRVTLARAFLLFVGAGTFAYPQAWVFLTLGTVGEGATNAYLLHRDQELLRRRLTARSEEVTPVQHRVQRFASMAFTLTLLIPALDHRFGWSHVSPAATVVGDLMVVAGLAVIWLAFRANTFASAVVTVEQQQTVVAVGPYSVVRHPMYTGLVIMMAGVAPALGSLWGLLGAIAFASTIVVRLLDEEQFLASNLAGYADYRTRVRHRLAPLVW